jgi:hypothetical protein
MRFGIIWKYQKYSLYLCFDNQYLNILIMKNKVLLFIFALVTIPFMALAQGTGLFGTGIPVDLFTTFASLVLGIPFVVELVKRIFKPSEGIWTV